MLAVVLRISLFLLALVAIHLALDWYLRRDRLRRLERDHAAGFGGRLSREDYVARGLAAYERSWGRRMLAMIYVVPVLVALGLYVLANYG